MNDAVNDKPESKTKDGGDDIVREAMKRYDRGYEREQTNIEEAYEDLKFRAARTHSDQWDERALKMREAEGRPVLTINKIPEFLNQVTGDMRLMRPAIQIVPVDDQADEETADIFAGLIRYVEGRRSSEAAYFAAADSQVACGIGHWRVKHEYASDSTFEQELLIEGIEDGVSVIWDPDAIQPTREDAKWCFVPVDMSREAFEEQYPDASAVDFGEGVPEGWCSDDHVRVAEYWVKKPIKRLLVLRSNGDINDLTSLDKDDRGRALEYIMQMDTTARVEERPGTKVVRYLLTAKEVLEGPEDWIGRHIPIVPVIGQEVRIGRDRYRHGKVRYAKDPQRMYNYYAAAQTEIVALQPKAPFVGTEKNFENFESEWANANSANQPYLPYTPDPANGGQQPSRTTPPVSSQGLEQGLLRASDDMKSVIGIYDASLGARSNETSGRAIEARQREGDVGSFVYIDNFNRAVRYTGEILVDLIPKIYDTARTIRILGEDGKIDQVQINQPEGQAIDGEVSRVLNDVTIGSYDVVLKTGPAFSTRREEAREGMQTFMQANPAVAPLIMDIMAKNQDWPNADQLAKRVRHMLPPPIQAEEAQESGDPKAMQAAQQAMAAAQPQQDPAAVAAAAKAEADAQKTQLDMQVQMMKAQVDAQRDQMDIAAREQELAQKQRIADVEYEIKLLDLDIKRRQMASAMQSAQPQSVQ
ncbi:portal protein [Agaricicola taiwanensis]|uniref:Portal protein n=1 Tax=Agaricicola taiwanensis TaxID=591372 RepID=A0A8J2VRE9_9RHOB|nr:portal protein [Agaricicola taiwanensis]GGE36302.1 portal protein [Agaricicola taiwanensis]